IREGKKTHTNVASSTHHIDVAKDEVLVKQKPFTSKIHSSVMKNHKKNKITKEIPNEEFGNYSPPIPEDESPIIETSPVSQVLSLHKQGLSEQEIAKQLNMGAGEVELMIK